MTRLATYREMFCPGRESIPPEVNLRLAKAYLLRPWQSNDISLLLPELDPLADVPEAPISRGRCLLHYLAAAMGIAADTSINRCTPKLPGWVSKCVLLDPGGLHQLLKEDDEVSMNHIGLGATCLTPFWLIMSSASEWGSISKLYDSNPDDMARRLPRWASALRHGGVDLAAYGRRERELARESPGACHAIRRRLHGGMQYLEAESHPARIIGISFGAEVADWGMWWAREYEFFAREFWNMVENPPLAVPGSWEDDCRELERESWEEYVQLDLEEPCDVIWSERR